MWKNIVNPKTGRKVNLNSRIGKSVLRNYIKQLGGAAAAGAREYKCRICSGKITLEQAKKEIEGIPYAPRPWEFCPKCSPPIPVPVNTEPDHDPWRWDGYGRSK